ncbi:hypothetical protein pb186bvf_004709 [Paramecium bursaria]
MVIIAEWDHKWYFNYQYFSLPKQEIRKQSVKNNKKIQKKLKNTAYPFLNRWQIRIRTNPKKTIFFLFVMGIATWYGYPQCKTYQQL